MDNFRIIATQHLVNTYSTLPKIPSLTDSFEKRTLRLFYIFLGNTHNYIRDSYATSMEEIKKGIDKIEKAVEKLK
jgi:hypothetical protein